jgi:hypothetical protein
MDYVQAIGSPFLLQYSSNSDLKPKKFEWTSEDSPIKVFMDSAIPHGIHYRKKPGEKKIAWICESRAIFHAWSVPRNVLDQLIPQLEESYDAIYFADKEYCKKSQKFHFAFAGSNLPWVKEHKIFTKSKICSMFASSKKITPGHALRHQIAENLKGKIDIFGGAANTKRVGDNGSPWPDKSGQINDYMFQIVIENDSYQTYFTEKVTDCFATGTIPVYWGAPDIDNYFNKDGMIIIKDEIDLNLLTPEYYYSKLDAIKENFDKVQKMQGSDDILYDLIKQL